MRILCAMWHLLSKHKFREAAKLLAHAIHTHPFPASWVWRIAFQLFRCMDARKHFLDFNRVLDQFRLSDQNNRVLEQILHHMARGDFSTAHSCLSHRMASAGRHSSSESTITREPELDHVQRLQHLYEGLCYYGLWLQRLHSSQDNGVDEEGQLVADELAEKAFYRLQEVEILVNEGRQCDIFVKPMVEILEYFDEPRRARSLLVQYARRLPENPNTLRYLCEWYRRRAKVPGTTSDNSTVDHDTSHVNLADNPRCSLSPSKVTEKLLRYRIKFSMRVLPEPAPLTSRRCSSITEEKKLLRSNRPHISTIISCLRRGFFQDALDLAFPLLDHPSWAVYTEPWKLLSKSIQAIGKQSPEVLQAVRVRQRHWSLIHFKLPNLPEAARKIQKLFRSVEPLATYHYIDPLGPLLSPQSPMDLCDTQTDHSGMDTST